MKTDEKTKVIEEFLKEALCVDGKVLLDKTLEITTSQGKVLNGCLFEMNDSKRGKFYIAWLK